MVNSLSSGCVSGDRSEQSGLRHMEGGKESDRAAAPPGPCRACWAGESAKGSKQCQNTSRSSVWQGSSDESCAVLVKDFG